MSEDEWRFHSRYSGRTACQLGWILGRKILQKLTRRIRSEQLYNFISTGFYFCVQKAFHLTKDLLRPLIQHGGMYSASTMVALPCIPRQMDDVDVQKVLARPERSSGS